MEATAKSVMSTVEFETVMQTIEINDRTLSQNKITMVILVQIN